MGTPFFLANLDATDTNTDSPYNHFGGNSSYDPNVLLLPVPPGALYADAYHLLPGTIEPTTSCKIKGYGMCLGQDVGRDIVRTNKTLVPYYNSVTTNQYHPFTDLVIPLEDPTTGVHEQDFGLTLRVTQPESGASLPTNVVNIGGWADPTTRALQTFSMTGRKSYALMGCDAIIILVTQASDAVDSVVIVRFAS